MKKFGHYTTQKGLIGIFQNKCLWATNIKYLNDEEEFLHALDLTREIISSSKTKIKKEDADYKIYIEFINKIESRLKILYNHTTESIYTFSVSEEEDLLSQWRGYCPNNGGFCLLLNIHGILGFVKSQYPNTQLLQCVYDKSKKEMSLKSLLNDYWSKYRNLKSDQEKNTTLDRLSDEIALLASHFKHPSFSEEKEWRLVTIVKYAANEDINFREGKFSLIPYLSLSINLDHINSVVIGPTANKDLAEKSLDLFIAKTTGFPFMNIEHTKIPYRPW